MGKIEDKDKEVFFLTHPESKLKKEEALVAVKTYISGKGFHLFRTGSDKEYSCIKYDIVGIYENNQNILLVKMYDDTGLEFFMLEYSQLEYPLMEDRTLGYDQADHNLIMAMTIYMYKKFSNLFIEKHGSPNPIEYTKPLVTKKEPRVIKVAKNEKFDINKSNGYIENLIDKDITKPFIRVLKKND